MQRKGPMLIWRVTPSSKLSDHENTGPACPKEAKFTYLMYECYPNQQVEPFAIEHMAWKREMPRFRIVAQIKKLDPTWTMEEHGPYRL